MLHGTFAKKHGLVSESVLLCKTLTSSALTASARTMIKGATSSLLSNNRNNSNNDYEHNQYHRYAAPSAHVTASPAAHPMILHDGHLLGMVIWPMVCAWSVQD
jgi:hypothetical protein